MNVSVVNEVLMQSPLGQAATQSLQVSHSPAAMSAAVHTKHLLTFSPQSLLYVHGEWELGLHPHPFGCSNGRECLSKPTARN